MGDDGISTRATLKDTYDLVDQTRRELKQDVGDLAEKVGEFITSSEHRLTVVETHQAALAEQVSGIATRLDSHGRDIGTLKDRQKADEAATDALSKARSSRWSTRERVVTVVASVIIAVGAILALVH